MAGDALTLTEMVNAAVARRLFDLHTSIPARVEKFDKDKLRVDVVPMLKQRTRDEQGKLVDLSFAVIKNVPVAFYGAGGFRFTLPVKKGDPCDLIVSEADFSTWLKNGGEQTSSSSRRFNLNDAKAYFGIRPDPDKWTGAHADNATLGADGGPQIVFKSDQIHLGAKADDDATEKAYLGSTHKQKQDDMLDTWSSQLQSVMTDLAQAAIQLGIAAGKNAVPMYGGAAAASDFGQVASKLGSLVSYVGQIKSAIATYKSGGPYLSDKVKLK